LRLHFCSRFVRITVNYSSKTYIPYRANVKICHRWSLQMYLAVTHSWPRIANFSLSLSLFLPIQTRCDAKAWQFPLTRYCKFTNMSKRMDSWCWILQEIARETITRQMRAIRERNQHPAKRSHAYINTQSYMTAKKSRTCRKRLVMYAKHHDEFWCGIL